MQEQTSDTPSQSSYFRRDRYYYLSSFLDDETGWYFYIRGGTMHGPFPSREIAEDRLEKLINEYVMANDTGGR
jgi:Domain of unknown function (DUF6316)